MYPLLLSLVLQAQDPQAAARVRQMALARIPLAQKVAADAELLRAVLAKNALPESPAEIQRKDEEWIRNPRDPLRRELTQNACALRLRKLVGDDPVIVEAFLMDERGGLVCSTVETSDYWQGDEAKWQRTYQKGEAVFVDEPALDSSTHTFAVQLSVLVSDQGHKKGALTLALKVSREMAGGK